MPIIPLTLCHSPKRHTGAAYKKEVVPHNPVYDTTQPGGSLRYVAVSDKHLVAVTVRGNFQTVQSGISESAVHNLSLCLG